MVPPFLPPANVPPHAAARTLMAYPMPGVVVPPGSVTGSVASTVTVAREEQKAENENRVSSPWLHTNSVFQGAGDSHVHLQSSLVIEIVISILLFGTLVVEL